MANEIVKTLACHCHSFRLSTSPIINIANIALRAKKLDEVAQQLIVRHRNAVALDLGAGLDTRMFRIAPPSTVDWYEVDARHHPCGVNAIREECSHVPLVVDLGPQSRTVTKIAV